MTVLVGLAFFSALSALHFSSYSNSFFLRAALDFVSLSSKPYPELDLALSTFVIISWIISSSN